MTSPATGSIGTFQNVLPEILYQELLSWLKNQDYFPGVTKGGLIIDRTQIWFHRQGTYFNPLWTDRYDRWLGKLFPPILDQLINRLYQFGALGNFQPDNINSCLINYYKDGQAFIPKHIDSVDAFGPTPTIINLSIGATRTLRINSSVDYQLIDNSVIVMSGPSIPHEILKDDLCQNERWSLTFRKHLA